MRKGRDEEGERRGERTRIEVEEEAEKEETEDRYGEGRG